MINGKKNIDELVSAGQYKEAAKLAKEAQDFKTAATLYERIWDFEAAALCASQDEDLPRALSNALESGNVDLVDQFSASLKSLGPNGKRKALQCFSKKKHFAKAGKLAEELKAFEEAVEYYQEGHLDFDAARMLIHLGRDRDAGRILERALRGLDPGKEKSKVHLELGLVFSRIFQHESAVRHLQEASKYQETQKRSLLALVGELATLGMRDAARDVLKKARQYHPELAENLDTYIRSQKKISAKQAPKGKSRLIGGRYSIGKLLGSGASGRVYLATDVVSEKEVALKLLSGTHQRGSDAYARFVREAKLTKNLKHPNLIKVFDFSADLGYLVMEYMPGGSLEEKLKSPMPQTAVRRFCLEILGGLQLAHQRGIIHRDLKPANIFFDARGSAKIGDFGVAHLLDLGQTQTGGLIGTLAYMSPEQITGAPLTISADLYGVGITLFEALSGRLPFLGPDFVAQHLGEEPPLVSEVSNCSASWSPIITRLLAKNPGDRFASIEELRRQLQALSMGDQSSPMLMPKAVLTAHNKKIDPGKKTNSNKAQLTTIKKEEKQRYTFQTALQGTQHSNLSRAMDLALNRSVIIEHFHSPLDEAQERRLYALARGGGPFLQRVLSYEKEAARAIFEAPTGSPIGERKEMLSTQLATRLLKRLAQAVSPLHAHDRCHGGIDETTILLNTHGHPTLLVSGTPYIKASASPQDDVEQIMKIVSLAVEHSANTEHNLTKRLIATLLQNDIAANKLFQSVAPLESGEQLHALGEAIELVLLKQKQMHQQQGSRT